MSASLGVRVLCCKVMGYPATGKSWKTILSHELHRISSSSHSHLFLCPVPPSVLPHQLSKVPSNPSVEAPPLCRKIVWADDGKQSKTVITAVKSPFVLYKHGVCFVASYNTFQEFRKQKSFPRSLQDEKYF